MACIVVVFACGAYAGEVRVYAASSMTDVLTELAGAYQNSNPKISIRFSFAGSSTLAKQIEHGAPADIFVSADADWVEYLHKNKMLDEKNRVLLAGNELVLVSPITSAMNVAFDKSQDLSAQISGKLCTGDPAHVPVGKYAKQALMFYGWWDAIQPKLVGTEDVRSALAFVERGECAAGIVYKSDALLSNKVNIIFTFPRASHLPIHYPAVLIKHTNNDARSFWQYLQSDQAREIFERYGFVTRSNH